MTVLAKSINYAERIHAFVIELREMASRQLRSSGNHSHKIKPAATTELLRRPESLVPVEPLKAAGALNILFRPV